MNLCTAIIDDFIALEELCVESRVHEDDANAQALRKELLLHAASCVETNKIEYNSLLEEQGFFAIIEQQLNLLKNKREVGVHLYSTFMHNAKYQEVKLASQLLLKDLATAAVARGGNGRIKNISQLIAEDNEADESLPTPYIRYIISLDDAEKNGALQESNTILESITEDLRAINDGERPDFDWRLHTKEKAPNHLTVINRRKDFFEYITKHAEATKSPTVKALLYREIMLYGAPNDSLSAAMAKNIDDMLSAGEDIPESFRNEADAILSIKNHRLKYARNLTNLEAINNPQLLSEGNQCDALDLVYIDDPAVCAKEQLIKNRYPFLN